jgi:hypothetical protein
MNDAYVTLPFNCENDHIYDNAVNNYTTILINDMETANNEIGLTELHLRTNKLAYFTEKECEITVVELIVNKDPATPRLGEYLNKMAMVCRDDLYYQKNPDIRFIIGRTTVSICVKIQLDPLKVSESFDSFFNELKTKLRNETLSKGYPIEKFDPRIYRREKRDDVVVDDEKDDVFDTGDPVNFDYLCLKGGIADRFQYNGVALHISMKLAETLGLGLGVLYPVSALDEDQNDGPLPRDSLLMCGLMHFKKKTDYDLYDRLVTTKSTTFSHDLVHVCSNAVEQSNFGNSSINLLRTVMMEKGPGGVNQSLVFPNVHYVKASSNVTRFVNIKLLNNERKPYEFKGDVSMVVKLHVKPVTF